MNGLKLELFRFPAKFRARFAHASAVRSETENIICRASCGDLQGYGEGCPRGYVTGETERSANLFFHAHRASLEDAVVDLETLRDWISAHRQEIDQNPAAFAAIEIALLDLLASQAETSVEDLLGLPEIGRIPISAVFGVSGLALTAALATGYRALGMKDVKVKLSPDPERDRRRLRVLRSAMGRSARLRVDANNLFDEVAACTAHLEALQAPIWAIEEPLAARDFEGMCEVARERGLKIILDESAVLSGDLAGLSGADWIVNLRVSKLGGVIRSLDMLKMIRAQGLGAILGSHVGETSILARAGLTLAAACGADLQAAECGYGGYLLRRDLAHPQVRFNLRGILGADVSSQGLGIRVDRSFLVPVAS